MPKVFHFQPKSNLFRRSLDLPQKAPSRFVIFNAGNNPGDDGPAIFDEKAAEMVMAEFKKRGVLRLTIDYDHASIKSDTRPQDRIAAGWFTPDIVNGRCDAGAVYWTDAAKKAIENKEWLYISPVFTKDSDGRITSLVNLAITNNPATWGARPLIAASRGFSMDSILPSTYACLLALASSGDATFAAWANENAGEMLAMAGENAAAIQEGAKQYMVSSDQTAASATTDQNAAVAASATTDQTQVAASSTCSPEEQAARSLNPDSAALLARSQMAAETSKSTVDRSVEIEKLQKEKLLPKDGAVAIFARSCTDEDFAKFAANLRASNAVVRTAGVKLPVGGKIITTGKPVNTEIDKEQLARVVRATALDPKRIEARIRENREKAEGSK